MAHCSQTVPPLTQSMTVLHAHMHEVVGIVKADVFILKTWKYKISHFILDTHSARYPLDEVQLICNNFSL